MIEIIKHVGNDCFFCYICSHRIPPHLLIEHIESNKHKENVENKKKNKSLE
jgi:hypothetical protein